MNADKIDVTIVDTFLESFSNVFTSLFTADIKRGTMSFRSDNFEEDEVAVITGMLGEDHEGVVAYSMSERTARRMVQKMDMESELSEYGEVLYDVLGEWMNILGGSVTRDFVTKGVNLYTTPPSIILGDNFSMQLVRLVPLLIEMQTEIGTINVRFAIKKIFHNDLAINNA